MTPCTHCRFIYLPGLCRTGNPPYSTGKTRKKLEYSHAAIGAVWRTAFGLLIPLVLYLIYYRIYVLKELSSLTDAKKRVNLKGELGCNFVCACL